MSFSDRFHVHVVNVNYTGLAGMSVGHAHLLEDIISLVSSLLDSYNLNWLIVRAVGT